MKTPLLRLLLLSFVAVFSAAGAEPRLLNGVIARVNDAVITWKDIQNRIAPDMAFLERQFGAQPEVLEQKLADLRKKYIEELVEEHLIIHEFKTAGYKVPESFLEDRVNKDIRTFGDRVTLTKTLQAQGMTFESYRNKVKERTIIRLMEQQNVPQDPVISPAKMAAFYEQNKDKYKLEDQVKLRLIVVTNSPVGSLYSSKKMAEEVLAKLQEGVPFAELARVYSQGSHSAEGGDMDWMQRSMLRPDLAEKAFTLKAGERSGVIEAPDGYYIMLVEEVRGAHVKPLSELRDEIEATLKDQERRRLRAKWMDKLKHKSFVAYF
jgi:peptidyl-prolyl cis-trans isomerase SurA